MGSLWSAGIRPLRPTPPAAVPVPQVRCPPLAFICTLRLAVRHICQPTGVVSFSDGEIRVATTTLLEAPPLGSLHNTFRLSPPGTFCDVGQAEASPWVLTQPVEMYVPKPKCDMLGALSAPLPPMLVQKWCYARELPGGKSCFLFL